jgi:hypothetical protein
VIFTEAKYHPKGLAQFPVRLIPSLWVAPDDVRKRVASELRSMAAISLPAVVVEDTHPNPIQLPVEIRRVLLVRPTSFEYLVRLNEHYGTTYSAYLLCDSPDSPTWPYDQAQTRRLAGRKKWHVIGPIYRTPVEAEIHAVRARYGLSEDQEVCVFTMGGGGVKVGDPKGQDIVRFLRLALQLPIDGHAGVTLRPRCLRQRSEKLRLLSLLNYAEGSMAAVSLSDLALGEVELANER